jgi:hypothetical protein
MKTFEHLTTMTNRKTWHMVIKPSLQPLDSPTCALQQHTKAQGLVTGVVGQPRQKLHLL